MRVRSLNVALFVLIFSAVAAARAEWSIVSNESEFSADRKVEHRHLELREASTGDHAALELAVFSSKDATLRVVDDSAVSSSLTEMMQRNNCVAGVNGGYFDPNYAPVGLLVSDGRMIAPLRKARLLSGVMSVTNGRIQILRPAEFSMKSKPTAARQCGPFLVDRGRPIAGLNNTRTARRTFVATTSDRALIGYCSHVTLAQLGELLATPELKIQRALNMDGGSSSGFWFKGEKGEFSIREQKTVRDYLGVVAR